MTDQTIKVDEIAASKDSREWAEENICKKLCDVCLMSNGSKCTSYNFAMKGFDAGADLVINELMKYLAEYPLPAIGVDKILAKLKEIKYGE